MEMKIAEMDKHNLWYLVTAQLLFLSLKHGNCFQVSSTLWVLQIPGVASLERSQGNTQKDPEGLNH
jgi:hypothetical protein